MLLATDGAGNLVQRQVDYPGYWGGIAYQEVGGYVNIPLFDSQGTTRFAIWKQGSNTYTGAYTPDAYGNQQAALPSQPNPLQFVGQLGYYTDATGYIYIRARVYDPEEGVFVSRDPNIETSYKWSPYTFVKNNPFRFVDPTGRAACLPCCNSECGTAGWAARSAAHCKDGGFSQCNSSAQCDGIQESDCGELKKVIMFFADVCVESCDPGFGGEGRDQPFLAQTCCCPNANGTGQSCGHKCCESNIQKQFKDIQSKPVIACAVRCIGSHEQGHEYECRGWKEGMPDPLADECCPSARGLDCLQMIWQVKCAETFGFISYPNVDKCEKSGRDNRCSKKAGY